MGTAPKNKTILLGIVAIHRIKINHNNKTLMILFAVVVSMLQMRW